MSTSIPVCVGISNSQLGLVGAQLGFVLLGICIHVKKEEKRGKNKTNNVRMLFHI